MCNLLVPKQKRKYLKERRMSAFPKTLLFLLVSTHSLAASEKYNPLSDEFINLINSKQNSWKAGRNFPLHTPFKYIKKLMGTLKYNNFARLQKYKHDTELIASLPETFDPRNKWTNCPSLNEIRDQGACGSCWAISAVEAMTDQYCIHSNGTQQFHFSADDLMNCCETCGMGCQGGDHTEAWTYWKNVGIVSGGNYNSSQGCKPYMIPQCEHDTTGKFPPCGEPDQYPKCIKSCQPYYQVEYSKDKRRGSSVYTIPNDEDQIKSELFKNGPVVGSIAMYTDFLSYRHGVYNHTEGRYINHHAVKILGWGVEKGYKYWLVANSWNSDWGERGFFKILRGVDHCEIERSIVAGIPLIV